MDELRWFLLILGVLVIAGVYLYSRWQDWRHDGPPWRRRRRETREPFADERLSEDELRGALDELDSVITEQRAESGGREPRPEAESRAQPRASAPESRPDPAPDPEPVVEPEPEPEADPSEATLTPEPERAEAAGVTPRDEDPGPERPPRAEADPAEEAAPGRSAMSAMQSRLKRAFSAERGSRGQPEAESDEDSDAPASGEEKVIVLTVMAPEGAVFAGEAVIEALEACGLRFGEHRIFHRTLDTRNGPIALYSAANVVEPGRLDPQEMDGATTPGVALFLQLPGPFDGLAAFEQMLQTARALAQQLDGQLLDARRCDLTQQSIEHLREELVEYRRRAHLAARKAR